MLLFRFSEEIEEVLLYTFLYTKPEALGDNDFEIHVLLLMLILHLIWSI